MTTTRRFLWGGIGGLAPILATFLILEADIIGRYLSELGYVSLPKGVVEKSLAAVEKIGE